MNRLDTLREGGFSDTEIAKWVDERRAVLKEGGFADNEIESYFTGGPVVKEEIPPNFLKRLEMGRKFQDSDEAHVNFGVELATKSPEAAEKSKRLGQALSEAWREGYGERPTGLSPEDTKKLRDWGIFGPGPIRFANEAMLRPTAGAIDSILRGIGAASTVIGAGIEQAAEAPNEEGKAKGLGRDIKGIVDMALIAPMFGPTSPRFTKPARRPGGEIVDDPIGPLPRSGDFRATAEAIVPDAPEATVQAVQGKLHTLWEQKGLHPAEILEDAKTDPSVQASLMSKTPMLPEKYLSSGEFTKQADLFGEQPVQGSFRFMNEPEPLPGNVPTTYNPTDSGLFRNQKGQWRSMETEPVSRADMEWGLNKGRKNSQPLYKRLLDDDTTARTQAELALEEGYQPSFRFEGQTMAGGGKGEPPIGETKMVSEHPAVPPKSGDAEGTASWFIHKVYTDFLDNLHPISRLDKDAYQEARLFRGRFGVVKQFLENGTVDFQTLKRKGTGLHDILRKVEDHDGLNTYLMDQAEMRALGPDAAAAAERVKLGQSKFGDIAKELEKFREDVLDYLHDSGVLSKETRGGLKLLDDNYTAFAPTFEGGVKIPVDPLANIIRNTYHYIGLAQKNLAHQKIFEALEKAGIGVESKPSLSAQMGKAMRNFAKANGEKAPPASVTNVLKNMLPDDGANFSAVFDGKRRTLRIDDPEIIRAIRNLSPHNLRTYEKLLSHPASWLRAGVTLDPAFMAKNIIRDSFTALVTAGTTPISTARGLGHALSGARVAKKLGIKPTETFQDWLSSGGANATLVHLDQRYMQQSLRHLENQTGLMRRAWNVVRSPLDGLRLTSELVENAVRLGAFEKAMKGKSGPAAMKAAGFASREATLDFARIGAKTQGYNAITSFFNVGLQGPDRIARAFSDKPFATASKIAMGITVPSLMLWWANKDDPRYENLPQWEKDLFWIILTDSWEPISAADAEGKPAYLLRKGKNGQLEFNNGTIWRIPKPFEIGILFGTLAERAAEAYFRQNPDAFKNLSDTFARAFSLNVIPTAVAPFIEQGMNTSQMTGRKVIPGYLEKELPEYQYSPYTSEVSKFVGRAISALPGVREAALDQNSLFVGGAARAVTTPALIDNYVRAWTGGLGAQIMEGVDAAGKAAGILDGTEGPTKTLADIPFVKAFVVRHPTAGTQDIEDFYKEYRRNERYLASWKSRLMAGDTAAAERLADLGGDEIFIKMQTYEKALSQMGAAIRSIYKNPDIPPNEQRQQIDELYYGMHAVGKTAHDTLRAVRERLGPLEQPVSPAPAQSEPKSINPGIPLQ